MDRIIRKLFYHYEKEEAWLNEMAAKGLALVSYTRCRYVFVPCEPGEFIYRIELLPELPQHPESAAYIDFVEEAGVECVSAYSRWVYLRRKAADGPFEIYSDADLKIKHYKRIMSLWGIIGVINLVMWGIIRLSGTNVIYSDYGSLFMVLHNLNLILGLFLMGLCIPYLIKIRRLKKEKLLKE